MIETNAKARFGALKISAHDNSDTAIGLACLCERVDWPAPCAFSLGMETEVSRILKGGIEMSFRDYARRNCASDASAPKPPMSGTILKSSTVTPSRSTA